MRHSSLEFRISRLQTKACILLMQNDANTRGTERVMTKKTEEEKFINKKYTYFKLNEMQVLFESI